MGCRKVELERRWGKIYIDLAMGGYVPCNYCKCVHAPGINYYFEGEPKNEEQTIVS